MTNTLQFNLYPFTHKGINFVSRISQESRHAGMIAQMGEAFIQMNKDAIDEIMTIDENSSTEYIISQLEHINNGGTEMFLELAGE
jgi:hypothetical protein